MVTPKTSFFSTNVAFCFYFGQWYCKSCHSGSVSVLPARIVRNWDFKAYPVSDPALHELKRKVRKPMIDMSLFNAELYEDRRGVFHQVRKFREKMMILSDYVDSCNSNDELVKLISTKKHFFNNIHIYSLEDLIEANSGELVKILEHLIEQIDLHIHKCATCCAKGFICDICDNKEVLFSFEFEKIGRCAKCGAVFHKNCWETLRACGGECPVCVRSQQIRSKKI